MLRFAPQNAARSAHSGIPPHVRRRHPLRPQPHRPAAHRRRAHGAVQLAVRAPHGGPVHPARRGHGSRAFDARGGEGDPRGHGVARARARPGAVLPDAAFRSLQRSDRRHGQGGHGLSLLLQQGRARRDARRRSRRARKSRATTAAAGTARVRARPAAGRRWCASRIRKRARPWSKTWCTARSRSRTRSSTT